MLLSADAGGHVFLLVVKLIVAGLGAFDQLGQRRGGLRRGGLTLV